MRVAVCFSGHLRTFEKTFQSVQQHLYPLYDCDTFIHTWDTLGSPRPEDESGTISTYDKSDLIMQAYVPKSITIEKQPDFNLLTHSCFQGARTPPVNVVSKWYSAHAVNQLRHKYSRDAGMLYDIVLSIRTDMLFHEPIHIEMKNRDTLYVPGNIKVPENTYHDYMAYGFPPVMDTYFETGKHFDLVCSKLSNFRPEAVLTKYLQMHNIPVDFFNTEYSLVRMNGTVLRA